MGAAYAEATIPTVIGFWLGKVILKNKRRDWAAIIAFPVINFISGFTGTVVGQVLARETQEAMNYSAILSLAVSLALSLALFSMLKEKHSQ